ncbi:beta-ketoacyl-[acyl-carrier-protein] synthase family protein [Zooshikella marina]|uniref:beta-ketoacyl-[acyl-carrier-protein] synthase family protein n=1 Tax=Zooshikella ganghwensis TaxID=202772 RepID=UPI001BAE8416|nr:beta-ketoacyl-[acyl-carrier-protein] synthase family protein [Zooshikella ganghwensis]MBU2707240.1 beta-ketoacyl-[acyl-carrier-protein] synthase family protein [Zooshikella ganghwensis]
MSSSQFGLTAVGMTCSLGSDLSQIAARLFSGWQQGIKPSCQFTPDKEIAVAAVNDVLPAIELADKQYHCRNSQLLQAAILQIADQVAELCQRYGADRIGVVVGSSTAGVWEVEKAVACYQQTNKLPDVFHYTQQEMGSVAAFVAQSLSLSGIAYTVSTACSSSANVFASAQQLIKSNLCDAVIVGGADSLCQLTVNGFMSLESVAKGVCNPFSLNRSGITLGEGAALMVMEREPAEINFLGAGAASDAHHISAPHPEGDGAKLAIKRALQNAEIDATDVDYVNLHGTGTQQNDAMESLAMQAIFSQGVPASSTKGMTGHTLGAAGAIEAAICWLTLSKSYNPQRLLPPHLWDHCLDPQLPSLALVKANTSLNSLNVAMSNSFAFGGNNVSLLFGVS